MVRLEQVLRGIKSFQAKNRPVAYPRLPINPELLLKLKQLWEQQSINKDRVMLWAAVTLCFYVSKHS